MPMSLAFLSPGRASRPTRSGRKTVCSGSEPSTSDVNQCGDADISSSPTDHAQHHTRQAQARDDGVQLTASSQEKEYASPNYAKVLDEDSLGRETVLAEGS